MHNRSNTALLAVLAFGALMLLTIAFLLALRDQAGVDPQFRPDSSEALLGEWDTRTLSDDNSNGAYTGEIEFGRDFYRVRNDIVHTPIRIDQVRYELDGETIRLWVAGNSAPIWVRMLSADHALIHFADGSGSTLHMYRR